MSPDGDAANERNLMKKKEKLAKRKVLLCGQVMRILELNRLEAKSIPDRMVLQGNVKIQLNLQWPIPLSCVTKLLIKV